MVFELGNLFLTVVQLLMVASEVVCCVEALFTSVVEDRHGDAPRLLLELVEADDIGDEEPVLRWKRNQVL